MKVLKRKDSNEEIKNFDEWKYFFVKDLKKDRTWKEGYSAYELADYIFPKEENTSTPHTSGICSIIAQVFNVHESAIELYEAVPECRIKFDQFRHPREHDLAIWGRITRNGKTEDLFIGIEAKVDESFGPKVKSKLDNASPKSNLPKRIELLANKLDIGKDKTNDLYYQLLYLIAGCVPFESNGIRPGVYVAMILNFGKESKKQAAKFSAFAKFIDTVRPNQAPIGKHKYDEIPSYDIKFGDDFIVKAIFVPQNRK